MKKFPQLKRGETSIWLSGKLFLPYKTKRRYNMSYQYKMVQVPLVIEIKDKDKQVRVAENISAINKVPTTQWRSWFALNELAPNPTLLKRNLPGKKNIKEIFPYHNKARKGYGIFPAARKVVYSPRKRPVWHARLLQQIKSNSLVYSWLEKILPPLSGLQRLYCEKPDEGTDLGHPKVRRIEQR